MRHTDQRGRRQTGQARHAARRTNATTDVVTRRLRSVIRASHDRLAERAAHSRARILVIHDLATRETLALTLRYYGHEVIVAGDGREATALLANMTPDLVVMDWRTPGLSGFSLCLALRRRRPEMPIVVVTASDEVFDGEQPVNAWLQKPIDPKLLNQVIHDELAPVRSS